MRIALIVPGGIDRTGRERVVPVLLSLIERLARRHDVLAITVEQYPGWRRYALLGAQVVNLGHVMGIGRPGRWLLRLGRLLSALRAFGHPDVIHAFWAGQSTTLAIAAGRVLRVPVLVSIGGGELVWLPEIGYGGQGSRVGRAKIRLSLRLAATVSAGSHYALEPLSAIRPDGVWLPLGAEWRRFYAPAERPGGPPWKLLHVASINRVKDQATLLQAMRLLSDRGIRFELDFIGEDTLGGSIQRLACDLGLAPVVRFHGFLPTDELAPFYQRAHLYVHSSLHESMSAVTLEAAAAGIPTVGTQVGIIAEMAPHAALAAPPQDPHALADGILALLSDEQLRLRLGRAAQEFSRTHDADWTAAQFESLYSKLCSRR